MLSITPRERPEAGATPSPSTRASPVSPTSPTRTTTLVEPTSITATVLRLLLVMAYPSSLQHRPVAEPEVDSRVVDSLVAGLVRQGGPDGELVGDRARIAEHGGLA